ncbi:phage tail protein [Brevibacillus reuszeri]|uniref:phage tail protein n=1 Tax=Brevibacillus reuszeri TaxID=54915 RepID=UPI002898CFCA|nr:tail fiber protein [Brevibacillus reuszeri]
MSDAYLGEIRMFGGNYAPQGWALCNGQLLNISENEALYSLLGTTYGGDGRTTFGLPDLRGRIPVHRSSTIPYGSNAGVESVTVTSANLPAHTHLANASMDGGTLTSPNNAVWATSSLKNYSDGTSGSPVQMNVQSVSYVGGNQPHDNMMPSLTISFIISLYGAYPPHS